MTKQPRLPKHLWPAWDAARRVLGDAVTLDFAPGKKHCWRMVCGSVVYPLSSTPMCKEDEARYARQWAQRMMKGLKR